MTTLTKETYASRIPKCCSMQLIEQHEDMLLCWGLVSSIEKDYVMDCSGCDQNLNSNGKGYAKV